MATKAYRGHEYPPGLSDDLSCPLCGAPLYEERGLVWCSRVGVARRGYTCDYGVISEVTVAEHRRRLAGPPPPSGMLAMPDGTGFWLFAGERHSITGRFIVVQRTLVEVRRVLVGRTIKLEVLSMGSNRRFAAEAYEGIWVRVPVNFGGKRT